MQTKLRTIEKIHKIEQNKRDLLSRRLDSMRQQQAHVQSQLDQLAELKKQTTVFTEGNFIHSEMLVNHNRVERMLTKLITHQEHEQAVQTAKCASLQRELELKQVKVKGLEDTAERWQGEYQSHLQNLEDIALEEVINNQFARRA